MPKILIPLSFFKINSKNKVSFYGVRETYVNKLIENNLIPIFITDLSDEKTLLQIFSDCSGVLLMGGFDIDPSIYNEIKHEKTLVLEPKRDYLELKIVKLALKYKVPIIGICRGCQMLAIVSGGNLHQHIEDQNLDEEHGITEGMSYDDILNNYKHEILIDCKSKAYSLFQKDKLRVNSAHHQSINLVPKDFKISGKSPEGIIEIIEHKDPDYFCYGFQWHPEAIDNEDSDKIFKEFSNSVYNYSSKNTIHLKYTTELIDLVNV